MNNTVNVAWSEVVYVSMLDDTHDYVVLMRHFVLPYTVPYDYSTLLCFNKNIYSKDRNTFLIEK